MGEDVDYINEQITRVTRLPNSPDRSLPHLGKVEVGEEKDEETQLTLPQSQTLRSAGHRCQASRSG